MNQFLLQLIGYAASVFLASSLLVNNDIRFRWLNGAGQVAFIIYGYMIGALPVMITNCLLLIINIVRLIRIYNTKEDFDLVEVEAGDQLVQKYLNYYRKDIVTYFPEFSFADTKKSLIRFVVLRDLNFANIFVAELDESGCAEVKINYTVPKYRDFKVGRFIFEKENAFMSYKGIREIHYSHVSNSDHAHFLKVMGFEKKGEAFVKTVV